MQFIYKNDYYLTFGKITITPPPPKKSFTFSWLIDPHLFCILSDIIVFGEEQNNVNDEISCGHISVILRHNGKKKR